jgi:type II secretion system protein I
MVEVIVAIVILAVVVIGLMPFMATGRIGVERAAQKRVAVQIAAERLERGRAGGYPALANASGSVVRDGLTYNWTLTVTTLRADPADAASSYKQAEVSVTWIGAPAPVIVRTAVAP